MFETTNQMFIVGIKGNSCVIESATAMPRCSVRISDEGKSRKLVNLGFSQGIFP